LSDNEYVYPLIHNKVTSPHYVTPTLRRARLLDWLNEVSGCRAVVLAADAGYGKTTLLWQWEREVDFPCYWYKLDRNDRDWSLHISYLIETIKQRHPDFGRRARSMLEQLGGPGSSRPGVAAYLLAEMHERLTEPCTFIIDDWQFVSSVTEVRGLWNQILRDAPPTCRFVFLSRAKPQLQFARFKTHGGYAEMRTDALRFTDVEINELFRDIYNDPLDPMELAELEQRTEGWAASLQLVEVSLRERENPEDRRSFIESISADSDSDLFAFLAEEVLDQQDERTRDFLHATAIVRQITPELAERLAGVADGDGMLSSLESRGLFTYCIDGQRRRYRYHGLFREFLERHLVAQRAPGEIIGLHIHAASYFETHQEWPEAIHHYLRADLQPQAARLITRYGEDVSAEGRLALVDEWLLKLPTKAVRENARLSLLSGEVLGIRGQWTDAVVALERSRGFFAKKGDDRMESLACLKISTVLANHGDIEAATAAAADGLALAPADSHSIRLRLKGNLAITSTWMEGSLHDVVQICQRIAADARSRGWDHFAAIGLHNAGTALRHIGDQPNAISHLRLAAKFWGESPANPFADNSELVAALLAANRVAEASAIADSAIRRTLPWPRPSAEAHYGKALVLCHQGKFREAIEIASRYLEDDAPLGPTAELLSSLLVECSWLVGDPLTDSAGSVEALAEPEADPRLAPIVAPAKALLAHSSGCAGECLTQLQVLETWEARGASYTAACGILKIGALVLDHGSVAHRRTVMESITHASNAGALRAMRWWLREYTRHVRIVLDSKDGPDLLVAMAQADPEGWRNALVAVVADLTGSERALILATLGKLATRETTTALKEVPGADVADIRRSLIQQQAPRLYVRSFGPLSLHRGSWATSPIAIEKKRTRTLLGLLVANAGGALTREMVLDLLWPDADPAAAANSLNQTVFQLRRAIDADYRDGESVSYITSNVDLVQLNPDLVVTDLQEFRRLAHSIAVPSNGRDGTAALIDLIRGEFLAELRYEDWAVRVQTSVHAEVREPLLRLATRGLDTNADLAVRAACALLGLDPFDEAAQVALAEQLKVGGRPLAARLALARYARQLEDEELADAATPELAELMASLNVPKLESNRL
jgi:DNA-binding SARP family transcriptional activator/tetratricopeptide (TPR) repeat protein